ncbi:GntR family transcriptional regulator [Mammaliicoccus sciuri]|nr:GntR family transcriptional regulator [Mammaliicoccus sciuri]
MANKELSIYQKIRNDIINGDLTQNEKITESKLAQRYNVSRTPIREAYKTTRIRILHKRRLYLCTNSRRISKYL